MSVTIITPASSAPRPSPSPEEIAAMIAHQLDNPRLMITHDLRQLLDQADRSETDAAEEITGNLVGLSYGLRNIPVANREIALDLALRQVRHWFKMSDTEFDDFLTSL